MKTLVTCVVLLLSVFAQAGTKVLYYFGAGGETESSLPYFDDSMSEVSRLAQQGWQIFPYYAGRANSQSRALARQRFSTPVSNFTLANFRQALVNISNKIDRSELVAQDELLLIFNTHGSWSDDSNHYHTIETSNGSIELSVIDPIVRKALSRGIKVAVFDFSCYGGRTVTSLPENACGVSLSVPHRTAFLADPVTLISESLRFPGESVENIYLSARAGMRTGSSQPQINTEVGRMTMSALSALEGPLTDVETLSTSSGNERQTFSFNEIDLRQIQVVTNSLALGLTREMENNPNQRSYLQNKIASIRATGQYLLTAMNQIRNLRTQFDATLTSQLLPLMAQRYCARQTRGQYIYSICVNGYEVLSLYIYNTHPDSLELVRLNPRARELIQKYQQLPANSMSQINGQVRFLMDLERGLYTEFYRWTQRTLPTSSSSACANFRM